jgi:hypothetical protein
LKNVKFKILGIRQNLKVEENNRSNDYSNKCIYGMEPEKLRDEYIRIFEEKKKLEHENLILLDKLPILELSEKNFQEALIQIESLNEKNKQMTTEISNLKERITKLGLENAELMDLNHQYCEAIASFNSESGNVKSKNIVECTKIKKLEHELTNSHRKLSELEKQIEKLNYKRIKELEERSYIEKRYEDIIYEQENALANMVLDNEKVYKDGLVEKLFEDNNELSNKFSFTYNQAADKIEIFFDDEKLFDIDNLDDKKPLKRFKSMNLMKCKNTNEIPVKTKNKIVSDLSFSYFESDDSNDENIKNKKNLFNDLNDASTKEPSRPSNTYIKNTPQILNHNINIPFRDITTLNSKFKKKNLSCEFNKRVKNFLKIFSTSNNENINLFGSMTPNSINDLSCKQNTLKSFIQNKSLSFKLPNETSINFSRNRESNEFNNLEFTCARKNKRKSLSSSSLNKIINETCSQIKNENTKSFSSLTNKERELKKFYTPSNLKFEENVKTQNSLKSTNKTINPGVSHFSLANSISEKLANLSNKSSNFKSKLSFALLSRNKTEKLLSTMKNKLFYSENGQQNFILENLHIDQTMEIETNKDKMKILESYVTNQNIDNPLFKSTNSSFLNDNSFNSKVIRRTTLDNFNIISNKLSSIAINNFDEIAKNKNNDKRLIRQEKEVKETNSNNDSNSEIDSYQNNNNNSNYFTLADKKFILEDLIEEDKSIKGFEEKDCKEILNASNINEVHHDDFNYANGNQFIEDFNLFEQANPIGREIPLKSVENKKMDFAEKEHSVNLNINGESKSRELIPNGNPNSIYEVPLSEKKSNKSNDSKAKSKIHKKSLSNVVFNKIDFDNFDTKIISDFDKFNKCLNSDYKKEIHNHDQNLKANEKLKTNNDPNKIVTESIFEKIRRDLIISSKKSDNPIQLNKLNNKNLDIKPHACKNKGICHKHLKINKALNKNKSKHNFDSIFLNTDFNKKSNLSMGFNRVKSFQQEDENLTFENKENNIKNKINKLDLKSITTQNDKENLVNNIIRRSIANTSLKNEFLNELKLSKQNNFNEIKDKLLNEEEFNNKRLSTNITTNNHFWKYTINLIPSQESSFINKPNSYRSQINKNRNNETKNKNNFKCCDSSEHINISLISDCNPAVLEDNNNENLEANGDKENKNRHKSFLNGLDNVETLLTQKGFNDVKIDSQINNFCISSNAKDEKNMRINIKKLIKNKIINEDYGKSECYVNTKFVNDETKQNNEDIANNSVCSKSFTSSHNDNSKNKICLKNKNKSIIKSPYKNREIIIESDYENDNYDYSNSYRSRENLLNNAYVREKYFSSYLCQKNNNLNFKINLDLKILGNEGYFLYWLI